MEKVPKTNVCFYFLSCLNAVLVLPLTADRIYLNRPHYLFIWPNIITSGILCPRLFSLDSCSCQVEYVIKKKNSRSTTELRETPKVICLEKDKGLSIKITQVSQLSFTKQVGNTVFQSSKTKEPYHEGTISLLV